MTGRLNRREPIMISSIGMVTDRNGVVFDGGFLVIDEEGISVYRREPVEDDPRDLDPKTAFAANYSPAVVRAYDLKVMLLDIAPN